MRRALLIAVLAFAPGCSVWVPARTPARPLPPAKPAPAPTPVVVPVIPSGGTVLGPFVDRPRAEWEAARWRARGYRASVYANGSLRWFVRVW